MSRTGRALRVGVTVAVTVAALGACARLPRVRPWERAQLARPDMTFGIERLETRFRQHLHGAREGSDGGFGGAGGGCGCN